MKDAILLAVLVLHCRLWASLAGCTGLVASQHMRSASLLVIRPVSLALEGGFFFFFFSFIFISWRLITLQHCSGFCHTLKWISHGFTCIPHPCPPSHLPLHPIPLGLPSAPGPSTCLMLQPGLVICFTLDNIHVLMLFSWNIPPSPSPTESTGLFYTSESLFLFNHWPIREITKEAILMIT